MKTLHNKKIDTKELGENYFSLIEISVRLAPKEGFDFDHMEKTSRIVSALKDKSIEAVSLEDSDITYLKDRMDKSRWVTYNEELLDFLKYIKTL